MEQTKPKKTIREFMAEPGLTWNQHIFQEVKVAKDVLGRKPIRVQGDKANKGRLEKDIEKEMIHFLRTLSWPTWKIKVKGELQSIKGGGHVLKKSENAGFPDILSCALIPGYSHGVFLTIEVKAPGGYQSSDQQIQQEYIESGKGIYIKSTSLQELKTSLYKLGLYPFKQ
jgi:hypothetical protein